MFKIIFDFLGKGIFLIIIIIFNYKKCFMVVLRIIKIYYFVIIMLSDCKYFL